MTILHSREHTEWEYLKVTVCFRTLYALHAIEVNRKLVSSLTNPVLLQYHLDTFINEVNLIQIPSKLPTHKYYMNLI